MRIALDTNVLISASATRGLSSDVLNLILSDHQVVLGETVLAELERVLRAKLKVPIETVQETTAFLRTQAVVVSSAPALDVPIRDKDDVPVLSEAAHGVAEVLVTGDQDLLSVAELAPIPILTPRGLWELLTALSPSRPPKHASSTNANMRPSTGQAPGGPERRAVGPGVLSSPNSSRTRPSSSK